MTVSELREYGLERMDEDEIETFVRTRNAGVLGLPTDGVPYLLPLSFGYDGGDSLYFTYLVAPESRKAELSTSAEGACFLVYSVDSAFSWESVLLTGTIEELPEEQWEAVRDVLDDAWHPDIFQSASAAGTVSVYEFRIDDQSGIRHTGLPSGFRDDSTDRRNPR
jgi:nitroimidazol reductase NimA-like FMN-containing flavoprotein (pyridoxamine 5'-phosphate oxidase superfamily)